MASALVAGATGYIGGLLSHALVAEGREVRCLVRDRERAVSLSTAGCEIVEADVLRPDTLAAPLDGVRTAYYLVHSMGRGAGGDFAARDRQAAANFAAAASEAGIEQLVYLGGLGDPRSSEHLRSRHETAQILGSVGVPLTYFRAAAVIGAGSESFRTVLYLVKRLPAMITPRWTETRTQPIAIADVLGYLAAAPEVVGVRDAEVQVGGPDVTTYGGMMDAMAEALGVRRRLRLGVPLLSPRLSSLWLGLVTPVDTAVARPLVEGLATETVVTESEGMAAFDVEPTALDEAMRRALAEDANS